MPSQVLGAALAAIVSILGWNLVVTIDQGKDIQALKYSKANTRDIAELNKLYNRLNTSLEKLNTTLEINRESYGR